MRAAISLTQRVLNQEDPELSLPVLCQTYEALDETIEEARDLIRWAQPLPENPEPEDERARG